MAEIAPFRGWRYDFARSEGRVSDLIAPPYDVLDEADKRRLLARSDRNIVAIDLPHVPPKSAGPPHVYESAGQLFKKWMSDGTLVQEPAAALYAYHQVFEYAGREYTRRTIIARLKLEAFSPSGSVMAHEETFGGPKEDRLALMKATHANLSPVFALFRDPSEDVPRVLDASVRGEPVARGTIDGVEHRVWIVSDRVVIDHVVRLVADRKCYIADGHHRYTTALTYRDWVAKQLGGSLPDGHPSGYVMVVLGSMDDGGNLILPTHRVFVNVGDMSMNRLLAAWEAGCETVAAERAEVTVVDGASGKRAPLRFTNRAVLAELEPSRSAAWRGLDVAYLHRYLIDELYAGYAAGGKTPDIRYVKAEADAVRIAADEKGLAVICHAPSMEQLRDVSDAGDLMPQKSTYFYPKVATGLTIHPLF
ncbi:MAG: DUF1015 domain-containing protein [Phycisphaerales bacterium]|nr:DUF1015 domain-containing protein [Phycisphaerales bacterium]